MALLHINKLSIDYQSGIHTTRAVNDVSFSLHPKEILGIVGESGAGKSSIGLAAAGLLPKSAHISNGTLHLDKTRLDTLSEKAWNPIRGKRIGIIFQEHGSSLNPLFTVETHMRETLRVNSPQLTALAINERIDALLDEVGIKNISRIRNAYTHQLSGGQRQRVVIALALSANPELLIADEPVTALDVSIQYQILLLLKRLRKTQKLAILLITHNIGAISQIADSVIVMKDGSIVEHGEVNTILTNPKKPYSKMLINAVPKILSKKSQFKRSKSPYISIKDLSYTYRNALFSKEKNSAVLQKLQFHIYQGESVGILGESGSGKTTIARLLTGIQRVQNGSLHIAESTVSPGKGFPKNLRLLVQMVFQDPYSSLNPKLSIRAHLKEALRAGGIRSSHAIRKKSLQILDMVELSAQSLKKYPREFSGGQKQRIAIARTLAVEPRILICDEPTSALDVSVQKTILDLLKSLQRENGFTLIFISHDLPVVQYMCDSIAVLYQGTLVEHTDSLSLFHNPQHEYSKELVAMIPKIHWKKQ